MDTKQRIGMILLVHGIFTQHQRAFLQFERKQTQNFASSALRRDSFRLGILSAKVWRHWSSQSYQCFSKPRAFSYRKKKNLLGTVYVMCSLSWKLILLSHDKCRIRLCLHNLRQTEPLQICFQCAKVYFFLNHICSSEVFGQSIFPAFPHFGKPKKCLWKLKCPSY